MIKTSIKPVFQGVLLFLMASFLAISGCSKPAAAQYTGAPTKTYHDAEAGVSFEYPEDWDIYNTLVSDGYMFTIENDRERATLYVITGTCQKDTVMFDTQSDNEINSYSAECWELIKKDVADSLIIVDKPETMLETIDDMKFITYRVKGKMPTGKINFDIDLYAGLGIYGGNLYIVAYIKDIKARPGVQSILDGIKSSIRFGR